MNHSAQDWEAIKAIVGEALERPPGERAAFLEESCSGNHAILGEVNELVEAAGQADGVIDRRTDAWLGLNGPDVLTLGGQKIGRYVLQRLLAEGAMAAVYLAQQGSPHRAVAVKLFRAGAPMVDSALRFKREAEALGRLKHPNIAGIHEADLHRASDGAMLPFIAMEYVDGPTLTDFARQNKLDRSQRIRLLIKVARAVSAAHQQAVIHRDLKPANVLVDSTGEPKVLDFGIARVAATDEKNFTWHTTAGVLLGTPGYMSPEQASGRPEDVDVRTDVWALGVLLFELLTDTLPVDVRNTSAIEALRRIETIDPPPIGTIDRSLRGDIETIVGTALARDKEQRYSSAQALVDDLERVLNYEPIAARPPSSLYVFKRFVRRHRVGVSFSVLLATTVLAASIGLSVAFLRAAHDRDRVKRINHFMQEMMSSADPTIGSKDVTVVQSLDAAETRIAGALGDDPETEADVRSTLGWTYQNLSQYDRAARQLALALELRRRSGDTVEPAYVEDVMRYATVLRYQRRSDEAVDLANETYNRAAAALGPEHPSVVGLLEPIAGLKMDLGDFASAEREYLRAVELSQKVLGPTHEQTLTAMNNLADVYVSTSQYPRAEAVLRQLVEQRTRTAPGKLQTLVSRHNLAIAIGEQGRNEEAEAQLATLCVDAGKLIGPDHDTTLSIASSRAGALQRLGRIDEALAVQEQVLERRIAAFGASSDLTLKEMSDYAILLGQAERWEESRQAAERGVAAALAVHPPDHFMVQRCRKPLAAALDGLGRHDAAQAVYREVIAAYEQQQGRDSVHTLVIRNNLALSLTRQHKFEEAADMLREVLLVVQQKQMAVIEAGTERNLGEALMGAGDLVDAERHLLTAFKLSKSRGERPNVRKCAALLARLYELLDRPADAMRWQATARAATGA